MEFEYDVNLSFEAAKPLESLFNNFGYSLANIMANNYQLSVCRVYKHGCHAIVYYEDVQYNERVTDILFLHERYQDYKNHYSNFLSQEEFALWQNAIKGADKPAILKRLYQDNKISRAYLFKYAYNHPASLYELGKYNLFINNVFGKEKATQTEKIDELPLPNPIKDDLKLSLR
ncbi:hypothetical protein RVIR1_13650 [Candidatus Rickettsiella viridis]|uniref:Uncharacterized protein n=1 Tax=Candidatus Rickettsiella viridis TaxID=676208 RepID=A0A2Z5UXD5_9COXI|nr:hypothetical protein RVIR1_13650 [Candidatus Rickettsiella viridis]